MTAPESRAAEQSVREVAEMIAKFRTPPGLTWADLANDIETFVNAKLTTSAAAEAAMREAAEFYLDEQWGDVIDEPPVEMLAWLETHRPDCKGDIALARALATPSAQAERMMRVIEAARKIKPAWDDSNVAVVEFDILIETLAEALRALGET